jgi:hypothetical protein
MSDLSTIPDEKRPYANSEMNRYENTYRRTGRWLVGLFLLWFAALVCFAVLQPESADYGSYALGILFVAIFVVSVVRIVAYIRWTGKYPFYFLFRKSPKSDGER